MLNCVACIRRCVDFTLLDPVSRLYARRIFSHEAPRLTFRSQHRHSIDINCKRGYAATVSTPAKNHSADGPGTYKHVRAERPRYSIKRVALIKEGQADVSKAADASNPPEHARVNKYAIRLAVERYQDPLALATHVLGTLRKGDLLTAVEIAKYATTKGIKTIVCWNHIFDYLMKKRRPSQAMKAFNDMKKRAVKPDAHTFTILLRGLVENKTGADKAILLYKSMSADNSPLDGPSLIHTNAVLQVLAVTGEIDSMFGVAADLPVKGPNAADATTFTTILNALASYMQSDDDASHVTRKDQVETTGKLEMRDRLRHESIERALRIWDDIIGRWRAGDLWIDEKLVCAMGRVLLAGKHEQYCNDIFALVVQTMNIPKLGDLARITDENAHNPVSSQPADIPAIDIRDRDEDTSQDVTPGVPSRLHAAFSSESRAGAYVQPGNKTLSLLMETCTQMPARTKTSRVTYRYWHVLTSPPYSIIPDIGNYHEYLRVLRLRRAAREATNIVCDEMAGRKGLEIHRKAFFIAMSACIRNEDSPRVFRDASRLVKLMLHRMLQPDVKTLIHYVNLAKSSTDLEAIVKGDKTSPDNILSALQILGENATSPNGTEDPASLGTLNTATPKATSILAERIRKCVSYDKDNGLKLTKLLHGAIDKLLKVDAQLEHKYLARISRHLRSRLEADLKQLTHIVTSEMLENRREDKPPTPVAIRNRKNRTAPEAEIDTPEKSEEDEIREWVEKHLKKREVTEDTESNRESSRPRKLGIAGW